MFFCATDPTLSANPTLSSGSFPTCQHSSARLCMFLGNDFILFTRLNYCVIPSLKRADTTKRCATASSGDSVGTQHSGLPFQHLFCCCWRLMTCYKIRLQRQIGKTSCGFNPFNLVLRRHIAHLVDGAHMYKSDLLDLPCHPLHLSPLSCQTFSCLCCGEVKFLGPKCRKQRQEVVSKWFIIPTVISGE